MGHFKYLKKDSRSGFLLLLVFRTGLLSAMALPCASRVFSSVLGSTKQVPGTRHPLHVTTRNACRQSQMSPENTNALR